MKHVKLLAQCLMVLAMIFGQFPTVRAEPAIQSTGWLTFVSSQYGYAIQYPKNWSAQERRQPNRDHIVSDVWFGEQIHVVTIVPSRLNGTMPKNMTQVTLSRGVTAWRVDQANGTEYLVHTSDADFTLEFVARGDASANQSARSTYESMARTFTLLHASAKQPSAAPSMPRNPAKASSAPNNPWPLLVLSASVTASSIPLIWGDNSDDELGFNIYRWNGSANILLHSAGANVTTYTDTEAACGAYYEYMVTAYNADGESSGAYESWALDCVINPPSNLQVLTWSVTAGSITLTWDDNSSDELGFKIYRYDNAGGGLYRTVGAGTTSFTDTAAPCGDGYIYVISAYKTSGESSLNPSTYQAQNCVAPPSNLRVLTPVTTSSISFAWDDNSNDEQGFIVDRSGPGPSARFYLGANVTTFTDTEPACGDYYYYTVAAYNALGRSVANPTLPYPFDCLAPPSNLQALSSAVTSNSIPLIWNDNSSDELGFRIYRSDTFANPAFIGSVGAGVTSFTDVGLACGTFYYYYVKSYKAIGESAAYPYLSYQTLACPDPIAPSNLRLLTPSLTTSSIPLAWNDNSNDETGFKIYRNGSYLQSVGQGVTTFTDTRLQCSTFYYNYTVSAYNANGESAPNPSLFSASTAACAGPTAPSNLRALTSSVTLTSIPLAWDDNSNDELDFKIYRDGHYVESVGAGVTTFTDTGLQCNKSYSYSVRAHNTNGESFSSNSALEQTPTCGPTPPSNVRALTASITSSSISLLWDDNSLDETGFKVYIGDGSGYTVSVGANVTTYTAVGLLCNTYYDEYEVSAFNGSGQSVWVPNLSSSTRTKPCTGPNPPTNVHLGTISNAPVIARAPARPAYTIPIVWGDSSSNETGFKVYRSSGGAYAPLITLGANANSYNDSAVGCGVAYNYRVSSYNASGESVYLLSVAAPSIPCSQQWYYIPLIRKQ